MRRSTSLVGGWVGAAGEPLGSDFGHSDGWSVINHVPKGKAATTMQIVLSVNFFGLLQVLLHYQTVSEPAVIKRLISVLNKSTGEVTKKKPK